MYHVETEQNAAEEIDQLPAEALVAFAELRVVLETSPWGGQPYNREVPESAMRAHAFGRAGFVVYLVDDRRRLVLVVRVIWAG